MVPSVLFDFEFELGTIIVEEVVKVSKGIAHIQHSYHFNLYCCDSHGSSCDSGCDVCVCGDSCTHCLFYSGLHYSSMLL